MTPDRHEELKRLNSRIEKSTWLYLRRITKLRMKRNLAKRKRIRIDGQQTEGGK